MKYISTRGNSSNLDFEGVTLAGLASDGGLYVPQSWPRFSEADIAAMRGLPYADLAARIMAPFTAGSLDEAELKELCEAAYGRFAHEAVTPLVHWCSSITSIGCSNCFTGRHWRLRMWRCNYWVSYSSGSCQGTRHR